MSNRASEMWRAVAGSPIGRILGAAILPAWLLVLASASHGPPAVSAATGALLGAIMLSGGLIGAGFGLWCVFARDKAQEKMETWVSGQPRQSLLQHLVGLPGGIAFLLGCYQTVIDFDAWRDLAINRGWPGAATLSSWDTLLVLSAVSLIFFVARSFAGQR